ncbi:MULTISPECIES: hypothetical protein [Olivibacter]|uniref:NAD(P)-binding domain-containing protein n=2 Tax=Sphingobacteriaceae TaxID=84566 RepID=F4C6S8_SPHS2|nr:hypothetical protein [Olivibacter sp. LS-1]QEL00255.1 hypothetical protein FKG96_05350 [Olivibacter sp. LS-1]
MNILITGLNNYLGKRLAWHLADEGYQTSCLVRNEKHFLETTEEHPNVSVIRGDLVRERYTPTIAEQIDVAIYLSQDSAEWSEQYKNLELLSLINFIKQARKSNSQQLVYITRLRTPFIKEVQQILTDSYISYTIVRISNIIGKESILMEMMKKVSSRFIIFANQRLVKMRAQPIALQDLLTYLSFIVLNPAAFNQSFDIGGPDVLSYKEMLKAYMKQIHINRPIISVPSFNNRLSAFFISLTTGVSVSTARAFGENITQDLLCENNHIRDLFPHECLTFEQALKAALA